MKVLIAIVFIALLGFAYCADDNTAENGDGDGDGDTDPEPKKSGDHGKCDSDDDCLEGLTCQAWLSGCEENKMCLCADPMGEVYHPGDKKCYTLAAEIGGECAVGRQCWQYGQRCPGGGGNCVCQNADDDEDGGFCIAQTDLAIGAKCEDDATNCYYITDWGQKICSKRPQGFPPAKCVNKKCACPDHLKRDGNKCVMVVGKIKAGETCKKSKKVADSCEEGLFCKTCHSEVSVYKCRSGQGALGVTLGLVLSMLFLSSLHRL